MSKQARWSRRVAVLVVGMYVIVDRHLLAPVLWNGGTLKARGSLETFRRFLKACLLARAFEEVCIGRHFLRVEKEERLGVCYFILILTGNVFSYCYKPLWTARRGRIQTLISKLINNHYTQVCF